MHFIVCTFGPSQLEANFWTFLHFTAADNMIILQYCHPVIKLLYCTIVKGDLNKGQMQLTETGVQEYEFTNIVTHFV